MIRAVLISLLLLTGAPALAQVHPLVIAHRGASGERPEHTRGAYELAIDQGADFIEPDLVMSKDGALIVRHENEIGGTTDVASRPEFADRRRTRLVDSQSVTGWFTEDFTLAELKTLRARERLPQFRPGNTTFDGREPILTFQEVIDIARAGSARTGRTIGVAPELKHPSHFRDLGLDMVMPFVAVLLANELTGKDAPILIQCFEVGALKELRQAEVAAPLLQLIAAGQGPADVRTLLQTVMTSPSGLSDIATYADWIGVETTLIEPRDETGAGQPATSLIADAHAAGLKVVGWTFRAENVFLPKGDRHGVLSAQHGDLTAQLRRHYALGIDAVFSDFPGIAVEAR
ncbi:glycerophosphodiester phosphodiesterase [Brevundimonas sp.]|uniref:glycerophosphodiester phosphodiesterase n=1 Tax=Brevundimonas sp. TaxID=1871086 RepID=UPI0037845AB0